jgi:hypothetical protein
MTSGAAARDQGPGTGAAPHSAGTLVFVSSDGPVEVDASAVDQNIDCAEPTLGLSDGVASLRMGDVEREGKPGVGVALGQICRRVKRPRRQYDSVALVQHIVGQGVSQPARCAVRSHVEVSM